MRVASVIVVVWLLIGAFAAGQRHYYTGDHSCSTVGDAALTIIVGPLNYLGANPQVTCHVPQPSR